MKYLIFICLFGAVYTASAQSKKEIAEKQIKMIRTFEQDIDQGEKEMLLEKEEYFNAAGELIEYKEFEEKGRIKKLNIE